MNRRSFFALLASLPFIRRPRLRVVRTQWIKLDEAARTRLGLSPRIHKVYWGGTMAELIGHQDRQFEAMGKSMERCQAQAADAWARRTLG